MKAPAVYIMASQRNGTLYTGVTSDLSRRVHTHKQRSTKSELTTDKRNVDDGAPHDQNARLNFFASLAMTFEPMRINVEACNLGAVIASGAKQSRASDDGWKVSRHYACAYVDSARCPWIASLRSQ